MTRVIRLKPKDARAIAIGHPWVYRQAIAEKPRKLGAGAVVDLAAPGRRFLGRGLYDPADSVAVRIWTWDEDRKVDATLMTRRLRGAAEIRRATGIPDRTDAYRVANAEGDRLPGIVVERFGDWLAVGLAAPALETWIGALGGCLAEAVPARGAYLRDESRARLLWGEPAPDELVVREPTGRYAVDLNEPGKSGLFTDMREVRVELARLVPGRRFLNLFAHTGAFSATAAAAGADEVVSVDLSGRYLDVARRNVELSAPGYDAHETVAEDVFEVLARYRREGRTFDAILIDPPTFSSSKRSGTFSVKDSYRPTVRSALRILDPGGLLVCATNWRGITREQFLRLVHDAAHTEDADLRVLTVFGLPADYPVLPILPETAYLHVAFCVRV